MCVYIVYAAAMSVFRQIVYRDVAYRDFDKTPQNAAATSPSSSTKLSTSLATHWSMGTKTIGNYIITHTLAHTQIRDRLTRGVVVCDVLIHIYIYIH